MIECPKCGGNGGEPGSNFGDYGWHPCYFCGTEGFVTAEAMAAYIRSETEARQEEYRGYRPEWDDCWDQDEEDIRNEEDRKAQEAQMDWIDPSRVWVGDHLNDEELPF